MQKSVLVSISLLYIFVIVSSYTIAFAESTTVLVDKPMYLDGEVITISGIVSGYKTYPVSIDILDPTGDSINTFPILPDYWSNYELSVETGGFAWKDDGEYTVVVSHASIPSSEIKTFEYFHTVPSPKPRDAGNLGEEHAQAKLSVQVYNDLFNFTDAQFQKQSPWIRFEDGETVHRYASGVPLGFLFDTLGMSGQEDACYRFQGGKVYCTNAYFTFKFFINDQLVNRTALRDHVIQDEDEIKIIYDDQQVVTAPIEIIIPDWIRNVAGYWCNDEIDDASFVGGIQYLIENKIIIVPVTESETSSPQAIPSWIKNNACWWSDGQISDKDFASGLEFLIKNGIILV